MLYLTHSSIPVLHCEPSVKERISFGDLPVFLPSSSLPTSSLPTSLLTLPYHNIPPNTSGPSYNVDQDSPDQIQFAQTSTTIDYFIDSEPSWVVCLQPCSNAHHCHGCQLPVHTICGHSVAGLEGVRCYLREREESHEQV